MIIKPIRNDDDLRAVFRRLEFIFQAEEQTSEADERDVLVTLVEVTDLIFAVDSIPAIFSITADPFLVFTSNVFAILGLRSLYFALAGMISQFRYLKPALSLILLVVGVKMLAAKWLKLWLGDSFNLTILAVILGILATGVITSWLVRPKSENC